MGPYEDFSIPNLPTQPAKKKAKGEINISDNAKSFWTALASVVGSALTSWISWRNQNSVNSLNQELARQQNQWNLEQWQRENSFNSPLAQIERLRAAGLNPGMLMSGGIQNVAAQSPEMVSSQGRASAQFSNPFSQFTTDIKTAELMDAQRENIEADTKLKLANAGLTDVRRDIAGVQLKIQLKNGERLSDLAVQSLETGIKKMVSEIDNIDSDTAVKLLEGEKLRKYIDEQMPEEIALLKSKTGLNEAQITEIMQLLPTKILLNKAMSNQANANARLAKANAEFQEKLNASDEYTKAFIQSVRIDNMGKLVSLSIDAGNNQNAMRVGGQNLGIHGLYKNEAWAGDEALTNMGEVFGALGRLFSFIVKS